MSLALVLDCPRQYSILADIERYISVSQYSNPARFVDARSLPRGKSTLLVAIPNRPKNTCAQDREVGIHATKHVKTWRKSKVAKTHGWNGSKKKGGRTGKFMCPYGNGELDIMLFRMSHVFVKRLATAASAEHCILECPCTRCE